MSTVLRLPLALLPRQLTSVPPRFVHRVRDAAAHVHDLAQLGLAILCPCEDDHGVQLRRLGHEAAECCGGACAAAAVHPDDLLETATTVARPTIPEAWPDRHCPTCSSLMDPARAWWWTERGATCSEGCARDLLAAA